MRISGQRSTNAPPHEHPGAKTQMRGEGAVRAPRQLPWRRCLAASACDFHPKGTSRALAARAGSSAAENVHEFFYGRKKKTLKSVTYGSSPEAPWNNLIICVTTEFHRTYIGHSNNYRIAHQRKRWCPPSVSLITSYHSHSYHTYSRGRLHLPPFTRDSIEIPSGPIET